MRTRITLIIISIHIITTWCSAQVMWETTSDLAAAHFDNNHPRIAVNGQGQPLVIWGKGSDLMFSRYNGSNFIPPVKLNPTGVTIAAQDWMGPDIAAHGDTVYVVYKQTPEGEITSHIWCMRSFDGGINFEMPVQVENTGDSLTRFPAITTNDEGQPIIAFMKFNPTFGDARWAVVRSEDYGATFSADVKASGWSGPSSDVCDCCPGTIVSSGDVVAVIYRDNNINIRDNWAALSYDGGRTFSDGINMDQKNWYLTNCPASGPDGVIVGDSLYTIAMNGATQDELVYYNKASISTLQSPQATPVTPYVNGLLQNYPRMANYGTAVGMLWRHNLNFNSQLGFLFTSDITKGGFPENYDTLALSNVVNADVALSSERVFVVWQDNATNTIKYKTGEYETRTGIDKEFTVANISIFPNPSNEGWHVQGANGSEEVSIELTTMQGIILQKQIVAAYTGAFEVTFNNVKLPSGMYAVQIKDGRKVNVRFVVKE